MSRKKTREKIILIVLDVLLALGAIATVLTIDGGKWLFGNTAYYSASAGTQENEDLTPRTGGGIEQVKQSVSCMTAIELVNPYWDVAYQYLNTYQRYIDADGLRSGERKPIQVC